MIPIVQADKPVCPKLYKRRSRATINERSHAN